MFETRVDFFHITRTWWHSSNGNEGNYRLADGLGVQRTVSPPGKQ